MKKELYSLDEILENVKKDAPESHKTILEQTEKKILDYRTHGGVRKNAGRKKAPSPKITCSFSLPNDIVVILEQYSKENSISKSKALEEILRKSGLSAQA